MPRAENGSAAFIWIESMLMRSKNTTAYASPIWYPIVTHDMKQLLLQVQRTTAEAVVKGFRTVALSVAEVEAGLLPFEQRLHNHAIAFWVLIQKLSLMTKKACVEQALASYKKVGQ